jgi:ATP-dependent DNA helicase Q1
MPFRAAPVLVDEDDDDDDEALRALWAAEIDAPRSPSVYSAPSSDWSVHGPSAVPTPRAIASTSNGVTAPVPRGGFSVKAQGKQRAIDLDDVGDAMMDVYGDDDDGDAQLQQMDAEITSVEHQLADLRALHATLVADRNTFLRERKARAARTPATTAQTKVPSETVDYTTRDWAWSDEIKAMAKDVWAIESFRSLQEGVINAVLDQRDVLCIMPTGAGKSLCFQLPALLSTGTTVVISPLIALMHDQVLNLREKGVEAVALTASSGKEEIARVMKRLVTGGPADGSKKRKGGVRIVDEIQSDFGPEIKLLYVRRGVVSCAEH